MQVSNQEAQRFNQEYIGTEHILLALIKEGAKHGGVGFAVIQKRGVDHRKIRLEVEKLVQSGPDLITMGRLPRTPRADKVIEYTIDEARRLTSGRYVGTEHILLGLLREEGGVAFEVLTELGFRIDEVREAIKEILTVDPNFDSRIEERPKQTPIQDPPLSIEERPMRAPTKNPPLTKAAFFEIGPGNIGVNGFNQFLSKIHKNQIVSVTQSSNGDIVHITVIYSLK